MDIRTLAKTIAAEAHAGQDGPDGKPYIEHLQAVANLFRDDSTYAAALLHSIVKDTSLSFSDLLDRGIPQDIVDAVDCMTGRRFDTYFEYLMRAQAHPIAKQVVLADVHRRLELAEAAYPSTPEHPSLRKYRAAYDYLTK